MRLIAACIYHHTLPMEFLWFMGMNVYSYRKGRIRMYVLGHSLSHKKHKSYINVWLAYHI